VDPKICELPVPVLIICFVSPSISATSVSIFGGARKTFNMFCFPQYFCYECKLYDDEDKQQFHCSGCGICRVINIINIIFIIFCQCFFILKVTQILETPPLPPGFAGNLFPYAIADT
jgi:hypothetical protein